MAGIILIGITAYVFAVVLADVITYLQEDEKNGRN